MDKNTESVKVVPYSIEAEHAVLGGLMLNNTTYEHVIEHVCAEDFYRAEHQMIFQAIVTLADKGQPFDQITLEQHFISINKVQQMGGYAYLVELTKNTASVVNIQAYAKIIRNQSVLRKLIASSQKIADSAFNPQGRDITSLLDEAEQHIFAIANTHIREGVGPQRISTLLTRAVERLDLLAESDSIVTGLPTGFKDLDEMTSGMQAGELVIVAGRPSMGKTSFAMNIVEQVVISGKQPVLVFSMEMPGDALAIRMLSSLGRLDQHKVRTGKLNDADWSRINSAVALLSEKPLFIDDSASLSPGEVRARARRVAREQGQLGLIVIDYLQLMRVAGNTENRAVEIAEISRSLKALAKELKVPVVALSQLNRGLEQRPDKRPIMSDLRESGSIEQDADLILFIYRDEVYNKDSSDKGTAEIIIGKQRNGPIGMIKLTFLGQLTRFENYANQYHSH